MDASFYPILPTKLFLWNGVPKKGLSWFCIKTIILNIQIFKTQEGRRMQIGPTHLTYGTIWESDKTQETSYTREPSQEVSHFQAGDHKGTRNRLGRRFGTSKINLSPPPPWLRLLSVLRRWFCCCWHNVYCYSYWGVCNCSMFCYTLLYVHSSFAIILMGKRELVALLSLSSWCLVIVMWFFLAVP